MADQPTTSLSARGSPLASSEVQLRTLRQLALGCEFDGALQAADLPPLRPSRIDVFR